MIKSNELQLQFFFHIMNSTKLKKGEQPIAAPSQKVKKLIPLTIDKKQSEYNLKLN